MCLSVNLASGLFFGLAWVLASLVIATRAEVRLHIELSAAVWKGILIKALLATVPAVATVKLIHDWLESPSEICIGKLTSLAVAFAMAALLVLLGVVERQVRLASGIKLSQTYHRVRFLLMLVFSLAFFVIRHAFGLQ